MVEVTYHCPYCGAVTGVDRQGYLNDECVTREPLDGWEYATPADDAAAIEAADGIEFVCLGNADAGLADGPAGQGDGDPVGRDGGGAEPRDGGASAPDPSKDGCGRTFYLSFVRYEDGEPVDHRTPNVDPPRFDFRR